MLKKILSKLRDLIGTAETDTPPQVVHKKQHPKRENPTLFQATWDVLREHRQQAGLVVSGETRRVLRAQLKRRLSKVKV